MEKRILTLCLIREGNRVLLGMKKKDLGAGYWNGFGGKLEPGESIEEAARREVHEEAGIIVADIEKIGVLTFASPIRSLIEMHVYTTSEFTGTPSETDEMRPEWFTKGNLPFRQMWSSDLYWWPLFWRGEKFRGNFEFDAEDRVISHEVQTIDTL